MKNHGLETHNDKMCAEISTGSFDLGHWQCKNWPCSYLWHA